MYIKKNEFLTLLGPSGCGKTTTLRIIGGFEEPSDGELMFEGKNIVSLPPHKRKVNTVFQKYALFPNMNVGENIAFGHYSTAKGYQNVAGGDHSTTIGANNFAKG